MTPNHKHPTNPSCTSIQVVVLRQAVCARACVWSFWEETLKKTTCFTYHLRKYFGPAYLMFSVLLPPVCYSNYQLV